MGWGLKKFVKTIKKHHEEITKATLNPKRMYEHLKDPKKGMQTHLRHFAEFTETKTGKVAFAVIAWYVGGLAFGGAEAGAGAGVGADAGVATGTTSGVGTGTTSSIVGTGATETVGSVAASEASALASINAADPFITQAATKGFWSGAVNAAKGIGTYAAENPELAATVLSGVAASGTPDEIDLMEEQKRQQDEERRARNERLSQPANLGLISGAQRTLRDNYGNRVYNQQGGLINRQTGPSENLTPSKLKY